MNEDEINGWAGGLLRKNVQDVQPFPQDCNSVVCGQRYIDCIRFPAEYCEAFMAMITMTADNQ